MPDTEVTNAIRRMGVDSHDDDLATTPCDWLAYQGARAVGPLCEQLTLAALTQDHVASPSNYRDYVLSALQRASLKAGDASAWAPALRLFVALDERGAADANRRDDSALQHLVKFVQAIAPGRLGDVDARLLAWDQTAAFSAALPGLRARVREALASAPGGLS